MVLDTGCLMSPGCQCAHQWSQADREKCPIETPENKELWGPGRKHASGGGPLLGMLRKGCLLS